MNKTDMSGMKLISLWEPWASLMAVGAKKNETRSWHTNYRGWLAIHGAKRWTAEERGFAECRFCKSTLGPEWKPALGLIVAVMRLQTCWPTELIQQAMGPLSESEAAFGNYEEGRYAWITTDLFRLPVPIPFQGRQGLIDVPSGVLEQIRQQLAMSVPA